MLARHVAGLRFTYDRPTPSAAGRVALRLALDPAVAKTALVRTERVTWLRNH
jgi:hypothetical protein